MCFFSYTFVVEFRLLIGIKPLFIVKTKDFSQRTSPFQTSLFDGKNAYCFSKKAPTVRCFFASGVLLRDKRPGARFFTAL